MSLRLMASVGITALALGGGYLQASTASSLDSGLVASVYDGDTLTLGDGRRIRLVQIDTPELGSGECYSRAARTALLTLAPLNRRVVLEADASLDKVDRYGRLLRYIRRNGVNVNLELVRRGAATPYFYRGDRGRYASQLMTAARAAKAAKRGLWRACPARSSTPTPPRRPGRAGHPRSAASATRTTPAVAFPLTRPTSTVRTSNGSASHSQSASWAKILTTLTAMATGSAANERRPGTSRLANCRREPRDEEHPDDEWCVYSDGIGELHTFCPECAAREFGALRQSAT